MADQETFEDVKAPTVHPQEDGSVVQGEETYGSSS